MSADGDGFRLSGGQQPRRAGAAVPGGGPVGFRRPGAGTPAGKTAHHRKTGRGLGTIYKFFMNSAKKLF